MIRNLGQVAAIYIGSSAPRNTNLIWLDNTVVPFVFRAYDGSAWSEIATHKWVRAYVDGWLVTLPPRQLADDGDYMLINSNNVNYKITVKDFVKSAVGNPLDFKGVIRVSADFPNPSTLESGDMYVIITSPAGGTVTDPYSGKTFEDSEKIVWDEVTQSWESLGKIDITVDLTTSYSETEVTIHSSAGKETTIQGATDQLAGVMLPGQYSWLQALSNGSIVPGDPSPLTPLTPAHKHNYNDIINRLVSQQGTGESTIDPMSQKATTDALNLKFDKASVLQVSGAATDKVMSQKAVTDALKTLSDDFNNKLTNYLPLAGGTMKGNIRFPIGNGIACNDVAGTAAYVVLRTWNANNSTRMYVGTVNFPTYISSTASDLIHDRNGSSYLLWDTYNLSDPARLGVDQTFTGLNTFTKKTIIGDTVSPQILLDPAHEIRYRYASIEASRGYTIALGGHNNIREFTFGGYYSASKNGEFAYLSLPGQSWDTSTYRFYANSLRVPYKWSIEGPDGNAIIWSQASEIVNLGRAIGTTKIRSGNTDLIHTKGSTEYIIWDKSNLPNPASTTDLNNYLPLIGGTLTGQLTIKQSVDIKLRLQSTDADNHCIIQAINSQASQLGVFGYAGDKWAIGHNGTYYEIWDKYNLTNPVTYTTNTYNHATLTNKDGQYFTYIKAGTNGLLPHSKVALASGGSGLLGTSDQSFNAAYINNLHTNKVTFGDAGSFIDNQSGDSNHIGIGFYTSQNAACPVYVGSLCVSDSYAEGAPNIPTNGIYSTGVIKSAAGFTSNFRQTNLNLASTAAYSLYISSFIEGSTSAPGADPISGRTVNDGVLLTYFWRGDFAFQLAGDIDGSGIAYRSYAPSTGVSSLGWRFLADTNWVVSKINSSTSNYLPLTGGTLNGALTINGPNTLYHCTLNSSYTRETVLSVQRKGIYKAAFGYHDGIGAFLYNYPSAKYLFVDDNGDARVGTTNGSTKLALITDIPTVSGYLPLSGGTLTGTLSINSGGSEPLVINNSASAGEAYVVTKTQGTTRGVMGWNSSLGMFLQDIRGYTFSMKADGVYFGASSSTLTKLLTSADLSSYATQSWVNTQLGSYVAKSGSTMTGALTMDNRRNNVVVDVVAGIGNNWNEGAGALSVQVPSDNGQTPLILARRSGATINTTILSERLLDMALSDNGTVFKVGMSGAVALELEVTSFTNKVGIGKLFGKQIATTDQIPSIPSISISNGGSGNAVTAISASGHTLTVTKGATYLTSHQTIYDLTFQAGTFSAKTFDPNGAAATVNIPTKTSHITNDSGFITSSALNGYATQSWVNTQLGSYVAKSGSTMTGALTMDNRRNNVVVDVVAGIGNNWNEGAGALSVQVPSDNGQTPLILARRSGATINTTILSERLLDMALSDNGTVFKVGMSGAVALELEVTSFTNKVGIGKLFGKQIATTDQIPSIPSISISNGGSGNAVTAISASGHTLTVTKGATYLTSHQTIYDLTFQAGTFSAKTFDPNGAAATVNIPTKTSHITNDSGFITSSALNGYATQSWVNSQNFVKSTSTKKVTDIQPVDALPATQVSGVLYLVFG